MNASTPAGSATWLMPGKRSVTGATNTIATGPTAAWITGRQTSLHARWIPQLCAAEKKRGRSDGLPILHHILTDCELGELGLASALGRAHLPAYGSQNRSPTIRAKNLGNGGIWPGTAGAAARFSMDGNRTLMARVFGNIRKTNPLRAAEQRHNVTVELIYLAGRELDAPRGRYHDSHECATQEYR